MRSGLFALLIAWTVILSFGSAAGAMEPGVLRVTMETEPITLDWNNYSATADRYLISFMMRGLLKYDGANKLICDLCTSYTASADGKTLTFEINPNEVWSDGVKLEAQHFVDSLNRLTSPKNSFQIADDFRLISAARADGKQKLVITLKQGAPGFAHQLTTIPSFPIRKELMKNATQDRGAVHCAQAVLGPYQLAAWERGKRIVLEGNARYVGSRPVYRVDFFIGDHDSGLGRFKAGKADILSNPTTEDLIKAPGNKLEVYPFWATRFLMLNIRSGPTRDLSFRRGLLYALDRSGLPASVRTGERVTTGLIPPGLLGYRELPLVTRDLTRAQTERARVAPMSQPIMLRLLARDTEISRRIGQWLSEQLDAINVKLQPRYLNSRDFSVSMSHSDFDLVLVTWTLDIATALDLLRVFSSESIQNRGRWANVTYDNTIAELSRQTDPVRQGALIDQATQILEMQDVGAIPLVFPTQPYLLGKRVQSFAITPFGDPDLVKTRLK